MFYRKDVQDEDADFRGKLRKVQKLERLDKDNEGVKGDIWTKLRDTNPREYEKFAFKNGIKDHRAMLKRLTGVKKMNKKSPGMCPSVIWDITRIVQAWKVNLEKR